jgi:hypothetical protein
MKEHNQYLTQIKDSIFLDNLSKRDESGESETAQLFEALDQV